MTCSRVAVIVPTLNEASHIADTLRALHELPHPPIECIVADGGSTDATRVHAKPYATVVQSARKGRAQQMNAGARVATAPVLFFLHADTKIPAATWRVMHRVLAEPTVEAGTFRLRFDRSTPLLRFYAMWTRLPWWGLAFGDRGLFVRRAVFDALQGFRQIPIFEDLDMAYRLVQREGFRFVQEPVVTSARRFRATGPVWQQVHNLSLWSRYMIGAPPEQLADAYPYNAHVRDA